MKHTIYGISLAALAILALAAVLGISGRSVRKNELETAVNMAAEQSLGQLGREEEGGISSSGELAADFNRALLLLLESEADVKVDLFAADAEKGVLDVKVTETYQNLMGREETVSCKKSVILETYAEKKPYHEITFWVDGAVYDRYSICEGGAFVSPRQPEKAGKAFRYWAKAGESGDYASSGEEICSDVDLEAVFE